MSKVKIKPLSQAIHTKTRRPKEYIPIKGSPAAYQMDLLFLNSYSRSNEGYKGILNIINIPSRFIYAFPFKNKSDAAELIGEWLDAFNNEDKYGSEFCSSNPPSFLESDAGTEFTNGALKKICSEHGVQQFTTTNSLYVALVERSNRTLREILEKYFSASGQLNWTHALDQIVESYNAAINRTTHVAPDQFTMADFERMNTIYKAITTTLSHKISRLFKPGQTVIKRKPKDPFEKGATPGWGRQIYTIVSFSPPKSFELNDGSKVAYNDVLACTPDSTSEPPRAAAIVGQRVARVLKQLT
jgi:hypothetical protein